MQALAKPHVAPLTDERMKSLPAKCMAKEYVSYATYKAHTVQLQHTRRSAGTQVQLISSLLGLTQ